MTRKVAVTLTFMAEGESPEDVAQRALAAVAPMVVHPVVLCQIRAIEPDQDTPSAPEPDTARSAFDQIMGSPSA